MTQVVGFDVTWPDEKFTDHYEAMGVMNRLFKKWVFQKEKGEKTGYVHWQVRGHLWKKKTEAAARKEFATVHGGHWTITCNTVHTNNNFNYMMKDDTRLEGPWSDQDYEEPPVLTRQLQNFLTKTLYPWQQRVLDMCKEEDDRSIKIIYDPEGDAGKSIFAEYLEYYKLAFEMPPFRAMEDIMQFAFSFKAQKCYIIDMPRGMKKDKLGEFYAGLECLKNGVVYDKRYNGKKRRMDRPQIIVFTNTLPEFGLMTRGRWEVWDMVRPAMDLAWHQDEPPFGGIYPELIEDMRE